MLVASWWQVGRRNISAELLVYFGVGDTETRRDLPAYVIVSLSDLVSQASRVNGFSFSSPILAYKLFLLETLVGNSMPVGIRPG